MTNLDPAIKAARVAVDDWLAPFADAKVIDAAIGAAVSAVKPHVERAALERAGRLLDEWATELLEHHRKGTAEYVGLEYINGIEAARHRITEDKP